MSLFPPPDDNTISYSTMPPENVEEEVVEVFLSEEVKQKILHIASNGNLDQFICALQPYTNKISSVAAAAAAESSESIESSSSGSTKSSSTTTITMTTTTTTTKTTSSLLLLQHLLTTVIIDKYSSTTLHYAAGNGQYEICKYLLDICPQLLYSKSIHN